jgi:DNA gyrase subunit A
MIEIKQRLLETELKESYIDYAMSVIVGRALPDVRDGLKPVHRRILYAMYKMGLLHNKPFKKCARVVGEVLGKYHPHGDSAVYESLVRMAQSFSLRYPLIRGQGNFGSIDGDPPAAMRYTESKLSSLAEELLADIDKETVDFVPNFDDSLEEPVVLPSKIPNLLINGSYGIAVGMATNIPPHNLNEIVDATLNVIDNPDIEILDLMEFVKGPDFPTGGIILGNTGIRSALMTGKGHLKIRGVCEIEEKKIIISEIPYQVNKTTLIEAIANLVRSKRIEEISDIRDESDRVGMRVVIELKRNANAELVLNQLYKFTQLQVSMGINCLALVKGEPKILNLKELIENFLIHRVEVITKKTKFELDKAEKRAHILEGLKIALENIDPIIKTIKLSKDVTIAKSSLITDFELTDIQAQAILDMKLQKITSLETNKLREEYGGLTKLIIELKDILSKKSRIFQIIKDELAEIKKKYGNKRLTNIEDFEEEIEDEDLIKKEKVVITLTSDGYLNRLPVETYREQRRGGKGIKAMGTKEEDFVRDIFVSSTHDYLLCFTNKGKIYWLKTYKIPSSSRYSKGSNVVNLLGLQKDENINAIIPIKEFSEDKFLIMATQSGLVKKTSLKLYSKPRKTGIIGIKLRENDKLISVKLTDGTEELLMASSNGMAVRFNESQVRASGRSSLGVRGIRLAKGDKVVDMEIAKGDCLSISENGYGKRTSINNYRLIKRGGKGVINIKTSDRNGKVIGVKCVSEDRDVMFITKNGILIRTGISNISKIGRNTQGVRLMKLNSGDSVKAIVTLEKEKED